MLFAGIDENGLGPLLGPLVATAAATDLAHGRLAEAAAALGRGGAVPIDDSKRVFSQRSPRRGETAALAIVRLLAGRAPGSWHDLLDAVGFSPGGGPLFPCAAAPGAPAAGFCLRDDFALPLWSDPREVDDASRLLERAARGAGMGAGSLRSAVLCPRRYNEGLAAKGGKLGLDLDLFLELAGALRRDARGPVDVIAGRVGGRAAYEGPLRGFFGVEPACVARDRGASVYELPGSGLRIAFEVDADARHAHVQMASLVGKYARELFMEAVHRFAGRLVPGLRRASGYRDRVTKEFVAAVAGPLAGAGVDAACFLRVK